MAELPLLNVLSGQKPREIAARVLHERDSGAGGFVEDILEKALARPRLSPANRRLVQELVYGVVRWQATLDWLIARQTESRAQKPMLQILLRLGLYQIFWLDRVPNHAAVHETVELAKRSGCAPQAGFVNAVLRGCLREFEPTRQRLSELKETQPSLGYSHPEWLATRWQDRWGAEKSARLMQWNNTPPGTCARVNALKVDPGSLLAQWRDEQVEYDFIRRDWLEENLVFGLTAHPPLATLPSFRRGWFYVQDPSTLLSVNKLNPQPGESILDLCAAPGGKTAYIAQLMQNQGRLIAHDTDPQRLKLIDENCARLGVTCAETVLPEALDLRPSTLDRVLVDAPCSNTGVMRRRVDLRWRIRPEEIHRLRKVQGELLRQAAPLLKPGGTLVYSTCSLEPEENRELTEEFLRERPDFRLAHQRELLPFADGVDGAYIARLERV
jgi:16S rRNA (cytosine967-C5)-methyltransferase